MKCAPNAFDADSQFQYARRIRQAHHTRVVSGEREQIMTVLREKTDFDARKIGVQVLDVRLKRVDFPLEISDSVYRRMDAERKRVANELRASGAAEGEKIKANADKTA